VSGSVQGWGGDEVWLVKPQVRVRMCGCQCGGGDEVRLVKPQVSQDV